MQTIESRRRAYLRILDLVRMSDHTLHDTSMTLLQSIPKSSRKTQRPVCHVQNTEMYSFASVHGLADWAKYDAAPSKDKAIFGWGCSRTPCELSINQCSLCADTNVTSDHSKSRERCFAERRNKRCANGASPSIFLANHPSSMDEQVERLANKVWARYKETPKSKRLLIAVSGIPGSGMCCVVSSAVEETEADAEQERQHLQQRCHRDSMN